MNRRKRGKKGECIGVRKVKMDREQIIGREEKDGKDKKGDSMVEEGQQKRKKSGN